MCVSVRKWNPRDDSPPRVVCLRFWQVWDYSPRYTNTGTHTHGHTHTNDTTPKTKTILRTLIKRGFGFKCPKNDFRYWQRGPWISRNANNRACVVVVDAEHAKSVVADGVVVGVPPPPTTGTAAAVVVVLSVVRGVVERLFQVVVVVVVVVSFKEDLWHHCNNHTFDAAAILSTLRSINT